jgi:hypothetical protein
MIFPFFEGLTGDSPELLMHHLPAFCIHVHDAFSSVVLPSAQISKGSSKMFLDPAKFVEGMFMAAGGLALMLGLPMMASKIKGGLPLLGMAVVAGLFYLYDQGYIYF